MLLYHTGYQEIRNPDVHYGRENADFGQGFYTTDNVEFARRWAKERRGFDIVLNTYALETEGLQVYRLERTAEWFEYIYGSRRGGADRFPEAYGSTGLSSRKRRKDSRAPWRNLLRINNDDMPGNKV